MELPLFNCMATAFYSDVLYLVASYLAFYYLSPPPRAVLAWFNVENREVAKLARFCECDLNVARLSSVRYRDLDA